MLCGTDIFHIIFADVSHIHFECREYMEIFFEILSVLDNIVMDLNNAMHEYAKEGPYKFSNLL